MHAKALQLARQGDLQLRQRKAGWQEGVVRAKALPLAWLADPQVRRHQCTEPGSPVPPVQAETTNCHACQTNATNSTALAVLAACLGHGVLPGVLPQQAHRGLCSGWDGGGEVTG